jgi:hypothetical protein
LSAVAPGKGTLNVKMNGLHETSTLHGGKDGTARLTLWRPTDLRVGTYRGLLHVIGKANNPVGLPVVD